MPRSKPSSHRQARVERELRDIVASYISREFRNTLPVMVTVSRVEVSPDNKYCKVYVTTLGEESNQKDALKMLNASAYELQSHVGHSLRMKFTPKIQFVYDTGLEKGLKVQAKIEELARARKSTEGHEE